MSTYQFKITLRVQDSNDSGAIKDVDFYNKARTEDRAIIEAVAEAVEKGQSPIRVIATDWDFFPVQ